MKKKNFLKGLTAKLALAFVALTSTVLTSCEKENFNVSFEANPAKVYINASVIDASTNQNVTSAATITGTTEITGNKDIQAQTVTITATYGGSTASVDVAVAALSAGQVATYSPVIILSSDFELVANGTQSLVSSNTVDAMLKGHSNIDHNGKSYMENATEYQREYTIDWTDDSSSNYTEDSILVPSAALTEFLKSAEAGAAASKETVSTTFTVSAWSIFWATVTTDQYTQAYNVNSKGNGETVAKISYNTTVTTFAQGEEAHPSHASHYQAGHGHDAHGDDANAGGGIVWAE